MKQISLRVPPDLLAAVDAARGEVPRERWMRGALEAALGNTTRHAVARPTTTGERREVDARGGTTDHPAPPRTPDRHHPDYTLPAPGPSKAELDMDRQARLNAAREKGKR